MWEQWGKFQWIQSHSGHISNLWNTCKIFLWQILWNNNMQLTYKIVKLMMTCNKSTMVVAVAYDFRSHILILKWMYDTNMCLLKMFYDTWNWFEDWIFDAQWMLLSFMPDCFNDALLSMVNASNQYLVLHWGYILILKGMLYIVLDCFNDVFMKLISSIATYCWSSS